jgi:hypothetical protein
MPILEKPGLVIEIEEMLQYKMDGDQKFLDLEKIQIRFKHSHNPNHQ